MIPEVARGPKLIKNWWILALCGVLNAIISVIYLIMYDSGPDGPLTLLGWNGTVVFLNRLALAAGICTIAAGIWSSGHGKSWLLVLNGLALSAYGLIPLFWRGPLSFLLFARLLVVMAMSIGVLELVTARTLQRLRHVTVGWFLGLAGVASVGFALAFLALVFGVIQWKAGLFTLQFFFGFALTLVSAQSACWGWPCGCTAWVLRSPASKYTPQHSGVPSFRPLEIANGTLRRFRSQIAVPKGT